jgi:uncharacterized protein
MDLERRLYDALKKHIANPRTPKPDLFKDPPAGVIRQTENGPTWMVETSYDLGYLHGRVELSNEIDPILLEFLDPACHRAEFNFDKIAVVDTETTGLAGGTGTYAFIIGIGYWRDSKFVVRQYILRDFLEEPAQLSAFASDLSTTTSLMTYNGKTFDIPLLRNRYRINRLDIPFETMPHFDFIHPCRRLFKRHFNTLHLTNLEYRILGFERTEDVPSHLIPRLYFDYLQDRDDTRLLPILNHNRDDIVSLYMLVQESFRRVQLSLSGSFDDDLLSLSLGRLFFRAGDCERSQKVLANIKTQFASNDISDDMLLISSSAARKIKDWERAISIWNQMIKTGRFGAYPHIELAKYHEHRLKSLQDALDLTNSALRLLEFQRDFISSAVYKTQYESLLTRRRRLLTKLSKA